MLSDAMSFHMGLVGPSDVSLSYVRGVPSLMTRRWMNTRRQAKELLVIPRCFAEGSFRASHTTRSGRTSLWSIASKFLFLPMTYVSSCLVLHCTFEGAHKPAPG
jgi:hypothetical protein